MDSSWFIRNLIAAAFLPPLCFVFPVLLGVYWMAKHNVRRGAWLIGLSCVCLYLASTRWMASLLMSPLENGMRFAGPDRAQAIVVMGGGRRADSEYDHATTLAEGSSTRLQYAAYLSRQTGLPLLVTGGAPEDGGLPEAQIMQNQLTEWFHQPARWVEGRSNTSADNARLSAPLLKAAGVQRIILVSHGWHLPRAIPLFEKQGFTVIPAGVDFTPLLTPIGRNWIPSVYHLERTGWAMHEWGGRLWYLIQH